MGDTFITELRKDYPRGMVTPVSILVTQVTCSCHAQQQQQQQQQ
jgi:hypothetical protein